MSDPPKPTTPPLEALIQKAHEGEPEAVGPDEFLFNLGGVHYHIKPRLPFLTWRHRGYWFFRNCIDWIHP